MAGQGINRASGQVPTHLSLLRFKVHDDPLPEAEKNGLLHVVVEYEELESLIHGGAGRFHLRPEEIDFTVSKLEAFVSVPRNRRSRRHWKRRTPVVVNPVGNAGKFTARQDRHYAALVRSFSLPAGDYSGLRVTLGKEGTLFVGEDPYRAVLGDVRLEFQRSFSIEPGKITTVHLVPVRERNVARSGKPGRVVCESRWRRFHPRRFRDHVHVSMHFHWKGTTLHSPPEKVYVNFPELRAKPVGAAAVVLNAVPTIFELLGLRDGAVALMGQNLVPAGAYESFDLVLGGENSIVVEGARLPLVIDDRSQRIFRFIGPFDLRGGRLSEVFLDFDPNASIFHTMERGYVLDPTVVATSVVSMTEDQHVRVVQALGPRSNLVAREAELIFQGTVTSLATVASSATGGRLCTRMQSCVSKTGCGVK